MLCSGTEISLEGHLSSAFCAGVHFPLICKPTKIDIAYLVRPFVICSSKFRAPHVLCRTFELLERQHTRHKSSTKLFDIRFTDSKFSIGISKPVRK